ncbi:hypothetical protein PTKU46_80820 [Paraburkholderia terrae]
MQVTDIRAMAVIPDVQRGSVEKDKPFGHSGPQNSAHRIPVDERAGTLIGKHNLHEGGETLGDLVETRIACRLRDAHPVQERCLRVSGVPGDEAQGSGAFASIDLWHD